MVRPLRAGTSSTSPQAVESPVNRYTQVAHRNAWTPLQNRGKIVDMVGPISVLIAAAAAIRVVPNVGRLGLLFGNAGVDGAVELVFLELALDVSA